VLLTAAESVTAAALSWQPSLDQRQSSQPGAALALLQTPAGL
jgi:hypothetical protein